MMNGGASGMVTGGAGGAAGMAGGGMSAGGMGGSGGAAAPELVLPIERMGLHVLEFGETLFTVDGATGARVVEFSLGGENALAGVDAHPQFYGSSFWTTPESDWAMTPFTPVAEIDNAAYTMSVDGMNAVMGVSATAMFLEKSVTVSKTFSADLARQAVDVRYSMTNAGTAEINLGPWEVTRVPAGGLTFYPSGEYVMALFGDITVTPAAGHDWFEHTTFQTGVEAKSGAEAGDGWVAHVVRGATSNLLLIKTFENLSPAVIAMDHHEVEIFANATGTYVEVEEHGTFGAIPAGETVSWNVTWFLRELPPTVTVEAGNQDLIDAVTSTLAAPPL